MKRPTTEQRARWVMTAISVFFIAVSAAMIKAAQLGIDPYQCFISGMGEVLYFMPFGIMYTFVNLFLLLAMWFFGRKYIGLGTFLNLLFLGNIMQYTQSWLEAVLPTDLLVVRWGLFLSGIVLLCYACAGYFTADRGVSTYDFIALTMADKKIFPFRICRVLTDFGCVLIGLICGIGFGASVGVGTIITAFFMGPLVAFFREKSTDPILAKYQTPSAAKQ